MKSKSTAIILSFFGLHYFYLGKVGTGILYWFTIGGFFWWWIIDIFRFISMSDQEFNLLYNSTLYPAVGGINNQNNNIINISNGGLSKAEELTKYSELLEKGVITKEEFETKKKELL